MDSREQGKQNLWCGWLGHCTKCVSSSRSWHSVHLSSGAGGSASAASLDDTDVVEDTCRDPDDRRPPFEPAPNHPLLSVGQRKRSARNIHILRTLATFTYYF